MANYVKPLLTIDTNCTKEYVLADEAKPCSKGRFSCPICKRDKREFLCPLPFKVIDDYLCWTVAEVEAGSGLFGKYYHVTNIPPEGTGYIVIADIYRDEKLKLSIIRFMSEYGTESRARICLLIPFEKGEVRIPFTVKVVGEGFIPISEKFELILSERELKVKWRDKEMPYPNYERLKVLPRGG